MKFLITFLILLPSMVLAHDFVVCRDTSIPGDGTIKNFMKYELDVAQHNGVSFGARSLIQAYAGEVSSILSTELVRMERKDTYDSIQLRINGNEVIEIQKNSNGTLNQIISYVHRSTYPPFGSVRYQQKFDCALTLDNLDQLAIHEREEIP